ncbi:MAG: hypothetical protein LC118_09385 [Dehalococcoidia bacterium]|nr:hypothetical protein [Dehalococcoidia bacterium]
MLVTGDVKCLHCGYISGKWVGPGGAPIIENGFTPGTPRATPDDPAAAVRCMRCDGPVFLDDVGPVISGYRLRRIQRLRAQVAAFERKRPAA